MHHYHNMRFAVRSHQHIFPQALLKAQYYPDSHTAENVSHFIQDGLHVLYVFDVVLVRCVMAQCLQICESNYPQL